jgi:hypothetical protein
VSVSPSSPLDSWTNRQARTTNPTTAMTASAAVRTVSTKSGMTAGQAAEFGLTESTPTIAHSGRSSTHNAAGATIAIAAAALASSQTCRDAPCHSSAMK